MNQEANTKFDNIIALELKKELKRNPLNKELENSDKDPNLVAETLWQLINDLYDRVQALENKK